MVVDQKAAINIIHAQARQYLHEVHELNRFWSKWITTPEATLAVIANPDLAIEPSNNRYGSLESIREIYSNALKLVIK